MSASLLRKCCCGGGYSQAFDCCDNSAQDLFMLTADTTVAFTYGGKCLYWSTPVDPVGTIITPIDVDETYDECGDCSGLVCSLCNGCTVLPTATVTLAGLSFSCCRFSVPFGGLNSGRYNSISLDGTYDLPYDGGCTWSLVVSLPGSPTHTNYTSTNCTGAPSSTVAFVDFRIVLQVVGTGGSGNKWSLQFQLRQSGAFVESQPFLGEITNDPAPIDCGEDLSFTNNIGNTEGSGGCSTGYLWNGGTSSVTFS